MQLPTPVSRCARPTLVVADGDPARLDLARRLLLGHGYEVETAAGGVDCLAAVRWSARPVLVLDPDLPWGGADGVLAVLGDDPRLRRVPVVLTSPRPSSGRAPVTVPATRDPLDWDGVLDGIRAAVEGLSLVAAETAGA